MAFNGENPRQWRGLFLYSLEKLLQPVVWCRSGDDDPVAGVGHRAGNRQTRGQVVDKGSKSDALDSAPNENFDPLLLMLCV